MWVCCVNGSPKGEKKDNRLQIEQKSTDKQARARKTANNTKLTLFSSSSFSFLFCFFFCLLLFVFHSYLLLPLLLPFLSTLAFYYLLLVELRECDTAAHVTNNLCELNVTLFIFRIIFRWLDSMVVMRFMLLLLYKTDFRVEVEQFGALSADYIRIFLMFLRLNSLCSMYLYMHSISKNFIT